MMRYDVNAVMVELAAAFFCRVGLANFELRCFGQGACIIKFESEATLFCNKHVGPKPA